MKLTSLRVPRGSLGVGFSATFFVLLGLGIMWFARKIADVQGDAVLTSLVLLPALAYIALSGRLSELKGPGGMSATFVKVAGAEVTPTGQNLITAETVQIIEKASFDELRARASQIRANEPVLMTLTLGKHYTTADLEAYIGYLSQYPRFKLVAVVEKDEQFLGCISPQTLLGIARFPIGQQFVDAVARADANEVFYFPGTLREQMLTNETNVRALQRMTALKLDAMAIVDANRRVLGVVERDQLVSTLVLSLADRW